MRRDILARGSVVAVLIALVIILAGVGLYHHFHAIPPEQYAAEVGGVYGDPHPRLARVASDRSEGPGHEPMYLIVLDGSFHKGTLQADHLSFSALKRRDDAWAIRAFDDDKTIVWTDSDPPSGR